MKKLLFVLVIPLFLSSPQLNAQPFEYGDNVLNLGIGLTPVYYGNVYSSYSPGLEVSFEHGFFEKLGIGYIGIGGYFGYRNSDFDTQAIIAARGTYHFDFLDITGEDIFENLDVYAGVLMGLRFERDDYITINNYTYGVFDTFIGAHYYFSDFFGVYNEISYSGISYYTLGITFKF